MQTPPLIARTIVLAAGATLFVSSVTLSISAQNSLPGSAVQAAKMPQYASRLAPATRPASRPNLKRKNLRSGSPQDGDIYDNGPINGTVYAWTINFGFVISDSFTITGATDVSGMIFGGWLYPGDVLESAEISITSSPNGGTSYFDQTVGFTQTGCALNGDGLNVCTEASAGFASPTLQPGTYWVNLQNASVNTGDPVYWDQNDGPSQAYDNNVGTIPSESFTLLGSNGGSPPCFGSEGKLQVIYNFTQQQGNGDGVVIDKAGNLYGTTANGGTHSAGFAFKLANAGGWLLDPLFNFLAGSTGGQPTGVIVGPNGSLYGGAQGGIQNCGANGSQYCGLVFNLRPPPTACANALCGWNENIPYRFSNQNDGFGTINLSASDQQGNLYGTTTTGGADNQGTVFQLTPSGDGWTKTTLYSFTAGSDGYDPSQVLVGNDGNLYGVASGYVSGNGVVFQLTPSGGQWTFSVVHNFTSNQGSFPSYLVQDGAGNLYGTTSYLFPYAPIFVLEKTSHGWAFSQYLIYHGGEYENLNNLVVDAAGNLYGTGSGGVDDDPSSYYAYIFKASYTAGGGAGWHYQDLDYLGYQYFPASGTLALDPTGNLYGTTYECGTNGYSGTGTVWQLSP
jgi:uncharacterized repeat protein (TIGR03803 family)